jgi:hypothetical protein
MYAAVPAMVLNLAVVAVLTLALKAAGVSMGQDATVAEDYS